MDVLFVTFSERRSGYSRRIVTGRQGWLAGPGLLAAAAAVTAVSGAAAGASRTGSTPVTRFLVHVATQSFGSTRSEIVASDGRVIRVVARNDTAAISPNQRLIAWDGAGGIRVENVDGSRSRLLVKVRCAGKRKPGVTVDGCGGQFAWSSDSRHLLVQESNTGLAAVSVDSGAVRQVVAPARHVTYTPVGWSARADALAFILDDEGGANGVGCCAQALVLARPSGGTRRTVYDAREPIHDRPAPAWSPNGRWIAFTTDGRDLRDPRLAIVEAATGKSRAVKGYAGYTAPPVWAPDSSRFAAGSYQGPIAVYSAAGAKLATLPATSAVPLFWTGGEIYFMSGAETTGRLLAIPAGGGAARTVFTLPAGQMLLSAEPL